MSRLERWTYICLITLCLVSGGFLVKDHLRSQSLRREAGVDPAKSMLGKAFPVRGADWQSSKLSMVVFLSSSCHFCEASVPFYSRLLSDHRRGDRRTVPVVAVSAEPKEDLGRHFTAEHLDFDQIYQIPLPNDLLRGTPTLMVVDEYGIIRRAVVGQLPPSREEEFLQIARTGQLGDDTHSKGVSLSNR